MPSASDLDLLPLTVIENLQYHTQRSDRHRIDIGRHRDQPYAVSGLERSTNRTSHSAIPQVHRVQGIGDVRKLGVDPVHRPGMAPTQISVVWFYRTIELPANVIQ
jgi:hypothetical protein